MGESLFVLILILTAYSCFKGEEGGANWANYDIVYKWSIGWAHTHIEGEAHKGGYNNVLFIQRFPGKHRRLLLFVTKKYFYSLQNSLEALKIFFIICCSGGPLARMHVRPQQTRVQHNIHPSISMMAIFCMKFITSDAKR